MLERRSGVCVAMTVGKNEGTDNITYFFHYNQTSISPDLRSTKGC